MHFHEGNMNQNANEPITEDHAPAPVDDFFFHFVEFVYQRRKAFIIIGLSAFAALFSVLGWFEFQSAQMEKRHEQLYQLESKLRATETNPTAFKGLEAFLKKNKGTSQATLARMYRANTLGAKGDLVKAAFELEQLLGEIDPKSGLFVVTQVNLANLLRDQGKDKKALEILDQGAGMIMQDALLIEKAEIFFAQQNQVEAKKTLNRLLEAFPSSLYKQRAEQLLKAL